MDRPATTEGYSLSPQQERAWRLRRAGVDLPGVRVVVDVEGPLDRAVLERALDTVVRRHEILRTELAHPPGLETPLQAISPADAPATLASCAEQDEPVAVTPASAFRAALVRRTDTQQALLLDLPATLADAPTAVRLVSAVAEACTLHGAPSDSEAPVQYADVAEWQLTCLESETHAPDREFWRRAAGEIGALEFPFVRERPDEGRFEPDAIDVAIDTVLADRVLRAAAECGAAPATFLEACWAALVWRLSGRSAVAVLHDGRRELQVAAVLGPLAKYLPHRLDISGQTSLADLRRRTAEVGAECGLREEFYAWLPEVEAASAIAFEFIESGTFAAGGARMVVRRLDATTNPFHVKLSVLASGGRLSATLWYDRATVSGDGAGIVAACLRNVLAAAADDPDIRVGAIDVLPDAESARERRWATAERPLPPPSAPVHHDIERHAAEAPDAPAVAWTGGTLTYGVLNGAANRVARRILDAGPQPEQIVAVMVGDPCNVPVAFLGVLKAGCAYMPVDPLAPAERVASLLDDGRVAIVVTDGHTRLPARGGERVVIDLTEVARAVGPAEDQRPDIHPNQLAYVMHTSGSTGRPKGVMVTHAGLRASVDARIECYGRTDRFVLVSPYTFDSSAAVIYGTLCSGGQLLVADDEERRSPTRLLAFIARHQATHLLMVPSLYTLLLSEGESAAAALRSLKGVIVAGEACPRDLLARHRAVCPDVKLYNEYGPTEATIWATVARIDDGDGEEQQWPSASIGRAIAGGTAMLLDASLHPALPGTSAEIFIGGPTVARGYLEKPGETAARFVPSPFGTGERLYRTGDLARRAPSGDLLFAGRADDQIKINGFRIEPAEVEAALRSLPGVRNAAVVAVSAAGGSLALGACIEADEAPDAAALDAAGLKDALRRTLPAHMIPTTFGVVHALPRTATGKIDRDACAALTRAELRRSTSRRPETPLEIALSDLWRELLGIDEIGVDDDFFTLGGHSLLAIRLLTRARELTGCDVKLHELFETPTVAGLARRVQQAEGTGTSALELREVTPDPATRFEAFPLTSIQEAYWVGRNEGFELGNVGSTNYFEFDVPDLDIDRFTGALRALIARHDMLRATIHPDGYQQVAPEVPPYVIETIDLRDAPAADIERSLDEVRARMSRESLRTDCWPLFKILAHLLPASTRLHIATELVVCDAVSSRILLRDLYRLYHEPDVELPPLEMRFRDYVVAERALREGERFGRAQAFWQAKLETMAPAPELPLAKDPRHIASPHFLTLKHELTESTWKQLTRRAAEAGVTPTAVLCAAYSAVLATWAKAPQFTLNLTTYTRLPFHRQVHELVGDFTSLTMVEVDGAAGAFSTLARNIQQEIWRNLDHPEFGGVDVMRELRRVHGNGSRALMPVVFTSQLGTTTRDDPAARRWLGELAFSSGQAPQVWIDHQVAEPEGRLQFWWDYLDELFPEGMVEQIFAHYCALLERLAFDDGSWSAPPVETLREFVETMRPPASVDEDVDLSLFPGGVIHAGFVRAAARRPAAVAVAWEDEATGRPARLTYAALRGWANRVRAWVAESTAAAGIAQPATVAVVLPKGWEQVAAVLGVSWGGGTYLPIDVTWPVARVHEVMGQTACRLAVSTSEEAARLGFAADVRCLRMDTLIGSGESPEDAGARWDAQPAPPAEGAAAPGDLAYVIYTSGSTGTPKGVMIEHRAACVTLAEVVRRWRISENDRVLALSSLSFDLSVFDIFGVLAAGGAVVIPAQAARRDPAAWVRLVTAHDVTVWNSVPALLEMAVEYVEARDARWPGSLRLVMLSGDWIPVTLPRRLHALAPSAHLVSLGGATEAAIWSIAYELDGIDPAVMSEWRSIPYGTALAGQTVQVLRGPEGDAAPALTPCPPWVTGRIYIGGAGLARGYWNNEDETRRRFVVDPRSGARLYDTGDLGRTHPDGTIELLGRADQQVKIQGYRVELGEIEATLMRHPLVAAAVAAVHPSSSGTGPRLVAYVVPRSEAADARAAGEPRVAAQPTRAAGARPGLQEWIEKLEFKLTRPGLRRLSDANVALGLARDTAETSAARAAARRRRTSRSFDQSKGVTVEQLGRWLECLSETADGDVFKREYPSAGSLYPVQAYVYAKPESITGLAGGLHYYDPLGHRLVALQGDVGLRRELYDPVNRGVFDRAAFAVFLVGKLSAMAPLYGEASRDFCLIEAGCMSQLLTTCAPEHGVGVCPIGGMQFEEVRPAFGVADDHVLLHSLLGGALLPAATARPERERPADKESAPAPRALSADDMVDALKGFARELLPPYLVPARIVIVERLPLSANGKVDRTALPAPPEAGETQDASPLRTDTERAVAAMWEALLRLPVVNANDDFFALGGDSIASVRFINRARDRYRIELPLREFLGAPTVDKVAALIERTLAEHVDRLDEEDVQRLLQ